MFLLLCFAVGPGLVANIIFKDHWGRARPMQVVEFGGDKSYTPPLTPSDQCARNCSFFSGEASAIFALFFAAALVVPQWSTGLIFVGILAGLADGTVRVLQGAHFMSDVLFAGHLYGAVSGGSVRPFVSSAMAVRQARFQQAEGSEARVSAPFARLIGPAMQESICGSLRRTGYPTRTTASKNIQFARVHLGLDIE
jgi:membrane-associated PAP2 superfamily phosphatase